MVRYNSTGSLDASFNGDGILTTSINASSDQAFSLGLQSDGKIVVAGNSFTGTNLTDFSLVRYNSDGSLDTSFDGDGKLTTAIGTSYDGAQSLAVQNDGKIVLAGYSTIGSSDDFALARYNSNGSLDTTFDGDGKLTTAIGAARDFGSSIVIQSDGKIVVAGTSFNGSDDDFALVRYNVNGSLDTTFDGDGKLTTAIGTSQDVAYSVALQSDGKILVAGYSHNGSNNDFALVRYNSDGSLDTTFDGDGKLTTAVGTSVDEAQSIAVQSDGKIVVAGRSYTGSNYDFSLVRYNGDGSLDTTFDGDGKLTTAIGTSNNFTLNDFAFSVAIQSDSKIVAAGTSYNGSKNDFALVRYNINGSLDTTFDGDGKLTIAVGAYSDEAYGVALQADGRIVVAGNSSNGINSEVAIVRYGFSDALTPLSSPNNFLFDVDRATHGLAS